MSSQSELHSHFAKSTSQIAHRILTVSREQIPEIHHSYDLIHTSLIENQKSHIKRLSRQRSSDDLRCQSKIDNHRRIKARKSTMPVTIIHTWKIHYACDHHSHFAYRTSNVSPDTELATALRYRQKKRTRARKHVIRFNIASHDYQGQYVSASYRQMRLDLKHRTSPNRFAVSIISHQRK